MAAFPFRPLLFLFHRVPDPPSPPNQSAFRFLAEELGRLAKLGGQIRARGLSRPDIARARDRESVAAKALAGD
jgi:hypothetical protein